MEFKFKLNKDAKKLDITLYMDSLAAIHPEKFPESHWTTSISLKSLKLDAKELEKFLNKYLNCALSNLFYVALKDRELDLK